ncbi:MAG: hypothetical protein ACOCXA_00180 [Planctomycetota bacterium]
MDKGESAAPAIDSGFQQRIRAAYSAQKQGMLEAARSGSHPERLSTLEPATPFDRAAWQKDPAETAFAYAQVAEPGRIHDSGTPEDPPLQLLSSSTPDIDPAVGHQIRLRAQPYAPISLSSPDRVLFPNGLVFATVVADENGLATVDVAIPDGTVNIAHIHIASPVAQDTVEIQFDIQ